MQASAKMFFGNMYPGFDIEFGDKPGGTRAGILVKIKHGNEIKTRFYMKTYHNAGPSSNASMTPRHPPDLVEMMAYRFFQYIGAGPKVVFPFYAKSTFIHFIATEEVRGFELLKVITDTNLQKNIVAQVINQFLVILTGCPKKLQKRKIAWSLERKMKVITKTAWSPKENEFFRVKVFLDTLYLK